MLVHEQELTNSSLAGELYAWDQAPKDIEGCEGYTYLGETLDEIDTALKAVIRVSVLQHPMNGPFFMAQAPIYP